MSDIKSDKISHTDKLNKNKPKNLLYPPPKNQIPKIHPMLLIQKDRLEDNNICKICREIVNACLH